MYLRIIISILSFFLTTPTAWAISTVDINTSSFSDAGNSYIVSVESGVTLEPGESFFDVFIYAVGGCVDQDEGVICDEGSFSVENNNIVFSPAESFENGSVSVGYEVVAPETGSVSQSTLTITISEQESTPPPIVETKQTLLERLCENSDYEFCDQPSAEQIEIMTQIIPIEYVSHPFVARETLRGAQDFAQSRFIKRQGRTGVDDSYRVFVQSNSLQFDFDSTDLSPSVSGDGGITGIGIEYYDSVLSYGLTLSQSTNDSEYRDKNNSSSELNAIAAFGSFAFFNASAGIAQGSIETKRRFDFVDEVSVGDRDVSAWWVSLGYERDVFSCALDESVLFLAGKAGVRYSQVELDRVAESGSDFAAEIDDQKMTEVSVVVGGRLTWATEKWNIYFDADYEYLDLNTDDFEVYFMNDPEQEKFVMAVPESGSERIRYGVGGEYRMNKYISTQANFWQDSLAGGESKGFGVAVNAVW